MFVSAKRQESQTPSNSGPASFPDPRLVYALVSYRAVMDFEWESLPWGGGYVLRVVARGMRPGVLHVQKAHKANERIHSQSHSLHKQQHEGTHRLQVHDLASPCFDPATFGQLLLGMMLVRREEIAPDADGNDYVPEVPTATRAC